jgi:hypothetical protein
MNITRIPGVDDVRVMLRKQASSGRITWTEAAKRANEARNGIMDIVRARSTAVGRAFAQSSRAEA